MRGIGGRHGAYQGKQNVVSGTWKFRFRMRRAADRYGPKRLLVLDFGAVSTKLAVLARSGVHPTWQHARVLSPADPDFKIDGESLSEVLGAERLNVEYGSVIVSGRGGTVRLLNLPGSPPAANVLEGQVVQTLGIDLDVTAMACTVVRRSSADTGKAEYSVLVATVPRTMVSGLRTMLESCGITPVSLTTAGAAALNVVMRFPNLIKAEGGAAFMEVGGENSRLIAFCDGEPVMIREFRTGARHVVKTLESSTGLDFETALKLYESGSFDFSGNVSRVVDPWLHQVGISLDFVERRFSRSIEMLRLFGGGARSRVFERIANNALRCEVRIWNPFEEPEGFPALEGEHDSADLFAPALAEGLRFMEVHPGSSVE